MVSLFYKMSWLIKRLPGIKGFIDSKSAALGKSVFVRISKNGLAYRELNLMYKSQSSWKKFSIS